MARASETARFGQWDGTWPEGKCDHIGCTNTSVVHLEISSPGSPYAADSDLCADHLAAVEEQVRAFLVALGVIDPISNTERNIQAAAGEHFDV